MQHATKCAPKTERQSRQGDRQRDRQKDRQGDRQKEGQQGRQTNRQLPHPQPGNRRQRQQCRRLWGDAAGPIISDCAAVVGWHRSYAKRVRRGGAEPIQSTAPALTMGHNPGLLHCCLSLPLFHSMKLRIEIELAGCRCNREHNKSCILYKILS